MKSLKFMAASLVALALVGCSEEQSTFDVNCVPGRAVIKGNVSYAAGTSLKDGKFVYDIQKAANQRVICTINNNDYDDNLSGQTVLEVVTDENGNYQFEIPTTRNGVNVTLKVLDFEGNYTVVKRVNNEIKTVSEAGVYGGYKYVGSVATDDIILENLACVYSTSTDPFKPLSCYATMKGTINQMCYEKKSIEPRYDYYDKVYDYRDAYLTTEWEAAKNVNLLIEVRYNNNMVMNYNATTDNNGQFTMQVPVAEFPAAFEYNIEAMPYDSKFTDYEEVEVTRKNDYGEDIDVIDFVPVTLSGWYSASGIISNNCYFDVSQEVYEFESNLMYFHSND